MSEPGRRRPWLAGLVLLLALPGFARGQSAPAQGKIVAMHGRVEHAPATRQDAWTGAQAFQSLFVSDRVRTLTASRAAILFVDETQVKLNAQAVLTVRAVKQPAGAPSAFELLRGEGWFRTKNPRSGVTITTPAAAAAIRGTEINLRVADDDTTTLTVIEGAVEFSNPLGSIMVAAGEEATARPGQAPTKRVILNPDDAVQWALYYPTAIAPQDLPAGAAGSAAAPGLARLQANDIAAALAEFESTLSASVWSRLGASIAYLDRGDPARARSVIAADVAPGQPGDVMAALHTQLAAIALANGEAAAARNHLDAALAADGRSLPALALSSSYALTRNQNDRAASLAASAIEAAADSVGGRLAAAEAAQAAFQLDTARRHLDAVLQRDPDQLRALVNRARIRFGTGDGNGAAADAARAAAIRPDDAAVRSLLGFIKLSGGDTAGAEADFTAAVQVEPELGEPHLGLGLLQFRRGNESEGLLEMLTATLLEPQVSLYQSYLGKAYYEAGRFDEGLAALASAKRLDPRDPTPWLYSSFFLRDQHRPVAALGELNGAIARNDSRAVYRSRLLLDRDLATKNISLAEVYKQLGFLDWAAFEAQKSVETDFTNASARLFRADAFVGLTDRVQAASGELLLHRLYAPVNLNSFNNFAEYTSLFERADVQATVSATTGNFAERAGSVYSEGGNNRAAYSALASFNGWEDVRAERDYRASGSGSGKLAFGADTDLFVTGSYRREAISEQVLTADAFGVDTRRPFIITRFAVSRDPNLTTRRRSSWGSAGVKHFWSPASSVVVSGSYADSEHETEDTDAMAFSCIGFAFDLPSARVLKHQTSRDRGYTLQAQHSLRLGAHQMSVGGQFYRLRKLRDCREQLFLRSAPILVTDTTDHERGDDRFSAVYVHDEFQVTSWLHLSAGVRFQSVTYDDPSPFYQPFDTRRVDPLAGASIQLSPTTRIRAAAFRNVNPALFAERLAPTTVAGFPIEQNEFTTSSRDEVDVAIERTWTRVFASGQAFARRRSLPILFRGEEFLPDAHAEVVGVRGAANWIVAQRIGVNSVMTLSNSDTFAYRRRDVELVTGINFVHERRVAAAMSLLLGRQRFTRLTSTDLRDSDYATVDAWVSYEFPRKRGRVFATVLNAFDRPVAALFDLFTLPNLQPDRQFSMGVSWQF